jgi:hypothetical protein
MLKDSSLDVLSAITVFKTALGLKLLDDFLQVLLRGFELTVVHVY